MQMVINPQGQISCLYSEEIDLTRLGQLSILRASHVEPDEQSRWWADLSPVNGPRLGPYLQRSQALVAEEVWLEVNYLNDPT